jgi:hypothetical protein
MLVELLRDKKVCRNSTNQIYNRQSEIHAIAVCLNCRLVQNAEKLVHVREEKKVQGHLHLALCHECNNIYTQNITKRKEANISSRSSS